MNKYSNCKNISWNKDNDNFAILNKADLMISDYSGVIFDFAFANSIIFVTIVDFKNSFINFSVNSHFEPKFSIFVVKVSFV